MPSSRPKHKPVAEMTIQELQERHAYNARRMKEPYVYPSYGCLISPQTTVDKLRRADQSVTFGYRMPSTSTYVQRISTEQAAIEDRLAELGVDNIQKLLRKTNLDQPDDRMHVDQPQTPEPRPIGAKQRALAKFVRDATVDFGLYY